ncbi:hypothetical protein M3Y99_00194700 [Aphelenchoides fujianensis]|nr:hypothetical protein M3Y99_00194700 [Aphelenchoides fujianensis]
MEAAPAPSTASNLEKAKDLRDAGVRAMAEGNFRDAPRFFHQCILLARGVDQNSAVALHKHSTLTVAIQPLVDQSENSGVLVDEQTKIAANECANRTAAEESTRSEAVGLMVECYLNLAECVLNGSPRSREDYNRALAYCDNVLAYNPTEEQKEAATISKGIAFMKLSDFKNALAHFHMLPQNEVATRLIDEAHRKQTDERRKRDLLIQANFARQHQNNERNGHADGGAAMNGHAQNGFVR